MKLFRRWCVVSTYIFFDTCTTRVYHFTFSRRQAQYYARLLQKSLTKHVNSGGTVCTAISIKEARQRFNTDKIKSGMEIKTVIWFGENSIAYWDEIL